MAEEKPIRYWNFTVTTETSIDLEDAFADLCSDEQIELVRRCIDDMVEKERLELVMYLLNDLGKDCYSIPAKEAIAVYEKLESIVESYKTRVLGDRTENLFEQKG